MTPLQNTHPIRTRSTIIQAPVALAGTKAISPTQSADAIISQTMNLTFCRPQETVAQRLLVRLPIAADAPMVPTARPRFCSVVPGSPAKVLIRMMAIAPD